MRDNFRVKPSRRANDWRTRVRLAATTFLLCRLQDFALFVRCPVQHLELHQTPSVHLKEPFFLRKPISVFSRSRSADAPNPLIPYAQVFIISGDIPSHDDMFQSA